MLKVDVFQRVLTAKRFLNRLGLHDFPPIQTASTYLKQNVFRNLYDDTADLVEVQLDGIRFILPRGYVQHYVFQEYEPITRKMILDNLRPAMSFLDVGAHIGYYSLLAAKSVGVQGHVYAIEPADDNLDFLRRNVDLNQAGMVSVHPLAAGKSRGIRQFHITESSDSDGFYPHPSAKTVHIVELEEVPLDEVIDGHVHAIKIDVEGAELEVLQGMQRILSDRPEWLCIEWNPACMKSAGNDPLSLIDCLNDLGYGSIRALDDLQRRLRNLGDVVAFVRSGAAPQFWYVNLFARRG